jgi:hypothetical protein
MAKTYKVIVNTGKEKADPTIEVVQGAGDRGQPVRIKAQAGAKYQLQELERKHIRLSNTTHAFDDENPPEKPVNRCWYSANPHWCRASGGRDATTGHCIGAPKPDFCADAAMTTDVREEMLNFFSGFESMDGLQQQ